MKLSTTNLTAFAVLAVMAVPAAAHVKPPAWPGVNKCVGNKGSIVRCTLAEPYKGFKIKAWFVAPSTRPGKPWRKIAKGSAQLTVFTECGGGLPVHVMKRVWHTSAFRPRSLNPALASLLRHSKRCSVQVSGVMLPHPGGENVRMRFSVKPERLRA